MSSVPSSPITPSPAELPPAIGDPYLNESPLSLPRSFPIQNLREASYENLAEEAASPVLKPPLLINKKPFEFLKMHPEQIIRAGKQRSSSFSPRTSPKLVQYIAHSIQKFLKDKLNYANPFLEIISQVMGQTYYNQYDALCSHSSPLIVSLHKMHILEPCLLAIQYLTSRESPFTQMLSENPLKLGLRIIEHPYVQLSVKEGPIKEAIDHIFAVSKQLKNPEMQDLIIGAYEALLIRQEIKRPTQIMAQEGLQILSRCMHEGVDRQEFEKLKSACREPFYYQKLFLAAIQTFCIPREHRLRLNNLQKESLLQLSLSLLLSRETAPMLQESQIRQIGGQILSMYPMESYSPNIQRLAQLTKELFHLPFIPLKGLQFILLWTQQEFDLETARSLLAGTREWDPRGEMYQFVMLQFLELNKMPSENQSMLYQLLRFLYCWRTTPANEDLISLPHLDDLWQECLKQNALDSILQEAIHREFDSLPPESSSLKAISLAEVSPNPLFGKPPSIVAAVPESPCHIWEKDAVVKHLRDSVLLYLLNARKQVTTVDLALHPRRRSTAVLTQIRRFNQIAQFFVGQLLALSNTLETVQSMVKTITLLQQDLLKHAAFEAALSIQAALQQASIARLSRALSLDKEAQEWSNPKDNFHVLRCLQSQNPHAFEVSPLLFSDLIHLRENPYEFTKEGEVNLDRLHVFGKIFNQFALRKQRALHFWATHTVLEPDLCLIKMFDAQSGRIDDDALQQKWWNRSQAIYHQ